MGALVRKQAAAGSGSKQEIQIARGDLVDGLYFFQLTTGKGQTAAGKFVIE